MCILLIIYANQVLVIKDNQQFMINFSDFIFYLKNTFINDIIGILTIPSSTNGLRIILSILWASKKSYKIFYQNFFNYNIKSSIFFNNLYWYQVNQKIQISKNNPYQNTINIDINFLFNDFKKNYNQWATQPEFFSLY